MSAKLKMAEYGGLEHDPDYFSVHFKDYMDEKLERNRLEITAKPPGYKDFSFFEERHWKGIKWVFWSKKSQQDDSRKRRRSDDDSAIREVRQNIRCLTFSACDPAVWHEKSFLGHLCDIFQEFGLQCFEGYRHCEMQFRDENKALTTAFQELKMVLRSVCEIHELPLAMTWVPCSSCDNLLRGHLLSEGVEFCNPKHGNVKSSDVINFSQVSKWSHLRKGWVAGTALSSPSMLCCWDMTQISLAEYPFVPYARRCKFHGWFTICLRSSYTGEEIYVLEVFLPKRRCPDKSWTSLSLILRTMKEKFETFKLASGQELGEELLFEFIDFKNVKRSHSLKLIQANRISRSLNSVLPSKQSAARVIKPGMIIKAKYENYCIIKFRLSLWPTLVEFQEEVAKRLKLEAGSYRVVYGDEEKEFTCDEDLQACQTMGKTLIVEQGWQCLDLYRHYEMRQQCENEDLKTALTKIRMLMTAVCKNHNLPLAFSWEPCGDCNALLRGHSAGYCENEPFFWARTAINNGMLVVGTEGNDISSFLPVLEDWRNGVVAMQLDSLDQPSMDAINSEMNFVNTEQNYVRH
ncbi:hypothetical protein Vadar_019380 [Vaccinium darrowii]|uniref:Uncharacterized protein n=1 Tax=Vaccinium darrowii TaxID=229202 RepID=A0ACB7XIR9_9ERIC|nr:hypothetical protein Vadar_019380 [Vaccinium darrowii]